MARGVDNILKAPPSAGVNSITGALNASHVPSPAQGVAPGTPNDATVQAASPGAVLGTGMNVDIYTPGIEAV
jgi:hypothetical protein